MLRIATKLAPLTLSLLLMVPGGPKGVSLGYRALGRALLIFCFSIACAACTCNHVKFEPEGDIFHEKKTESKESIPFIP